MPIIAWLTSKLTAQIALPAIGVLLLLNASTGIGLAITRHTLADRTKDLHTEQQTHQADIATWKAAVRLAEANDAAHAAQVKAQQDQVSQEKEIALQNQLSSARNLVDQWMRNGAAKADHGSSGAAPVPAPADPAASADGTPAEALVGREQLEDCATWQVVAQGWQDWWAKEQPIMTAGAATSPPN